MARAGRVLAFTSPVDGLEHPCAIAATRAGEPMPLIVEVSPGAIRMRNGGVHRGGILGQNTVDLPVVRDTDLTDADATAANLVLFGTPASNAVLAAMASEIPVRFDETGLVAGDRAYRDPYAAIFAIFPNPASPTHYPVVHGGASPDLIAWRSHLDLALLPDFIVYARGEVLDWDFWGSDWRAQD